MTPMHGGAAMLSFGQLLSGRGAALRHARRYAAKAVATERLRNFGVSAHIDSGKTTLTERILFYTGRIDKMHEVNGKDGVGAVMDSMAQERERGITIKSAATFAEWKDTYFNIIDTPGHIDFTVEVERSLRVLDGAILVVCAVGGVQSQTVTVDRQMKRYDVPRIVFINKVDRREAKDVEGTTKELAARLGLNVALVQIPVGYGHSPLGCEGVIDVIEGRMLKFGGNGGTEVTEHPVPEDYVEKAAELKQRIVEMLADVDEEIEEKFLADETPTNEEIHAAVRRGTIARTFVPVFAGTAKGNVGVQPLLDGVARYLPAPNEVKNYGIVVKDDEEMQVELETDPKKDLIAMAFKLDMKGRTPLAYVRVYQGVLKKGDTVRMAPRGSANWKEAKTTKVTRLVKMHSNELQEVDRIPAGEIGGVEGLECSSGDTLLNASQKTMVSCESIFVPAPVISITIAPKNPAQMQDLITKLKRFEREDPTFSVKTDPETNELTMSGMGELHLEIFVQRLQTEESIEVITGKPFVQFREYLPIAEGEKIEYDYRHKRQSGGRGQFAQLSGYFQPYDCEFTSRTDKPKTNFVKKVVGGSLPEGFQKCINKAWSELVANGPLLGQPVWGLEMVLTGGQTHEVDSSDFAFNIATKDLLRKTFEENNATLLEPMMKVETRSPTGTETAVQSLMAERMGETDRVDIGPEEAVVEATVPLRRMFAFIQDLRSVTSGCGEFTMEYSHHAEVPYHEAMQLVTARRAELEAREKLQAKAA